MVVLIGYAPHAIINGTLSRLWLNVLHVDISIPRHPAFLLEEVAMLMKIMRNGIIILIPS